MSLRLHVSNRLERLAEALHQKIAGEQLSWGTRCWIVVPSPAMRLWLEEWFCTNSGVFLGPEFCMLDELPDRLNLPGRRSPLPIELGTCLEARLAQQQPQLDPQALHGLARSLGLLFGQYAVFGQHLVQNWHEEVEDWQSLLWKELFGPTASWMCTVDRLRGTIPPLENLQIHVIGQSSPPPAYVPFLQRLAEHCPVHVYHLCPSTGWFGDLRSGKELSGLKRRWETQGLSLSAQMGLEEMILQEQPLLADLGRLHRLTQLQWAEIWSSDQVEDLGVDPTEDSSSLLSALQSDLFWMRVPETPIDKEPDCSVSVHLCRSTIVQVEALQQSIAHFLQEQPDCSWSEILITGPSIDQLRMLLESVFREVQWPLRWVDGGELTPLAQWWQALLALPFRRASTVEVSSLLLHPVLVEAFGWDQEQQQELALLLTQWKVWWGWDRDHRASWLKRELGLTLPDHPHEALGTWLQRIRDLFSAHCSDPDRWFCDSSLLPQVGQLLDALGQIHLFCRDLLAEEFTTVGAVARRLLALCESLGLVDRWSEDPALRVLRGIACNQVLEEQRLKSDSCCSWLRSSLQISTPQGRRDGIWVGGLAAVRGIPARAIFIVGMDEDSFPSPWYPEPLNRLEGTDQFPSRGEYDRLCLLEAILGARDRLAIFVACRADLASRRGPSASVQRLIEYLQKAYGCSEEQLIVHHHASLGTPLQGNSLSGTVLKEEVQESASIEPSQVALSALSRSIQNPLHSFLQHNLHWRRPHLLEEEPESMWPSERLQVMMEGLLALPSDGLRGRIQDCERQRLQEWREQISSSLPPQRLLLGEALELTDSAPDAACYLPALQLTGAQGPIAVVGAIGWVIDHDLVVPTDSSAEALLVALPQLLAWQAVHPGAHLLCLQDGRRLPLKHPDPLLGLSTILEWMRHCQEKEIPLSHGEIRALARGDELAQEVLSHLEEMGLACHGDSIPRAGSPQPQAEALVDTLQKLLKGESHAGT